MSSPIKNNSCPAVIQSTTAKSTAESPNERNFKAFREHYFDVCGKNHGNGEVGQPAMDAIWKKLSELAELHPECQKHLPQQRINVKVDEATLAYFDSLRAGGGFHFG